MNGMDGRRRYRDVKSRGMRNEVLKRHVFLSAAKGGSATIASMRESRLKSS